MNKRRTWNALVALAVVVVAGAFVLRGELKKAHLEASLEEIEKLGERGGELRQEALRQMGSGGDVDPELRRQVVEYAEAGTRQLEEAAAAATGVEAKALRAFASLTKRTLEARQAIDEAAAKADFAFNLAGIEPSNVDERMAAVAEYRAACESDLAFWRDMTLLARELLEAEGLDEREVEDILGEMESEFGAKSAATAARIEIGLARVDAFAELYKVLQSRQGLWSKPSPDGPVVWSEDAPPEASEALIASAHKIDELAERYRDASAAVLKAR